MKKSLVPELRFPEFRDVDEWEQRPIGEKVDLLSGFPFKSSEISLDSSGIPLMRGINITEGFVRHRQDIDRFYLGDTKNLEKYKLQKNDLVIGMDGSKVGKNSALITGADSDSLLIQRVARLRTESKATIQFIFQQVNSTKFHAYVDRINTSSGIPHISAKQINEFEIFFPTDKEQKKISDCLSSIDELITAHTHKHELLKKHKKGLIQQLFPDEGETVPKLRFPEFDQSWSKAILGEHVDLLSGYAFKSDHFSETGKKLLTPKNFTKNGFANFSGKNTKYTLEAYAKKYVCKDGDLLLLLTDLTPSCELLGKPLLLTKDDGDILLNQRIAKIIPKGNVEIRFLLYFFFTDYYRKRIRNTATGTTVRHSSNKIVASTVIYLPSEQEQQKISDFMSLIDDLITAQTQKIESLKAHKKGLMQQLFPAMDEVIA